MRIQLKYTGPTQHTRVITKKDAEAAGFVLSEDMTWGLRNRHALIVEDLDETALEYFKNDPDFRVKELDGDEEPSQGKKGLVEKEVAETSAGGATGEGSASGGGTAGGRGRTSTSTTTAP